MQNLKEMTKNELVQNQLEKNFEDAMQNERFAFLTASLPVAKKELIKYTSKFENTCKELSHCENCKGLFDCSNALQGHISYPKMVSKKLYFTYIPCKYQKKLEEKETNAKKLLHVMMRDIDTKDKKQLKVIKWMDDFYENFELSKNIKGLYLHGSFGTGKTFLLTALLNQLAQSKHVSVEITYWPDMLRDLKEDWENFPYKMKNLMQVDLLLIDDIGAEKVTDWARDEILGTILQHRMNNNKTTFFTSNLTITELESHLSLSNNGVDKVKARRIIERIKQLTIDMELIGENQRS